jgi:cell division inhibitor SepF
MLDERKSWFTRVKDGIFGIEEMDEDEMVYDHSPSDGTQRLTRQQLPLQIRTARTGHVSVRPNAQVFEDAKQAADGLKKGEQQVVNLEHATQQMAERIIDFLNGVTYAIDGTVERVGDKVFMFVPANISVEVDNGVTAANTKRSPFVEVRE